jgi:hypothetical protein
MIDDACPHVFGYYVAVCSRCGMTAAEVEKIKMAAAAHAMVPVNSIVLHKIARTMIAGPRWAFE